MMNGHFLAAAYSIDEAEVCLKRNSISLTVSLKSLLELVRQAVRTEIQELLKLVRDERRLLTIDEVAQRLSVSKDWVYRNRKKLTSTKELGPKLVRFSEASLQKWLKEKSANPVRF
jgi:excisionase family DNA binding protein